MEIYSGGRANGKTYKMTKLSAEKQIPIVCFSSHHLDHIKGMAKKMRINIPEPIHFENVRRRVIGNRKGLIVDDLDILLRRIFDDEVYYATMKICNNTICKVEDKK